MDTAHHRHRHRHRGRTHLEWISDRISGVLDPARSGDTRCHGWPVDTIRPVVAQAWRREFRGELGEPGLSDTAVALRDGRPSGPRRCGPTAGSPGP